VISTTFLEMFIKIVDAIIIQVSPYQQQTCYH